MSSKTASHVATSAVKKLPQITLIYWIIKIAITTLGETGGDMFAQTMNIGYATTSIGLIAFFLITFAIQMRSKGYRPLYYWGVILSTSMAGTTISDFMNRTLKFGYPKGASILTTLLVAIFVIWHFSGHHFNISKIETTSGEFIFWMAILVSNTLGTSLGDFLSDSSGLHYSGGAILVSALLALLVAAYYTKKVNNTLLFWAAFVLTRPLGATVGDFFSKPVIKGGMGIGTYGTSAVLLLMMVAGIVFQTKATHNANASQQIEEEELELAGL